MFVPAAQIRNTAVAVDQKAVASFLTCTPRSTGAGDRLAVRRRTETLMRAQTPVPKTVKLYLGLDATNPCHSFGRGSCTRFYFVKKKCSRRRVWVANNLSTIYLIEAYLSIDMSAHGGVVKSMYASSHNRQCCTRH